MDAYLEARRDKHGRRVRDIWIAWAKEQPDVADHPHWLTPWEDLDEEVREVDRRIGSALWGDGFRDGLEALGGAISFEAVGHREEPAPIEGVPGLPDFGPGGI